MTKQVLVVAAHADDETLGCFYAMRKHLLAGDDVAVLLMTSDKLRRAELRLALATLSDCIQCYAPPGLVDGQVHCNQSKATQIVLQTVLQVRPDIVYCHSRKEPTSVSDHEAVFKATLAALKLYGKPLVLMEYPIWGFCSCPWVPMPRRGAKPFKVWAWQAIRYLARSVFKPVQYDCEVYGDVAAKKLAMSSYRSQLPMLKHIASGKFLELFYAREVFKQSTVNSIRRYQ
jgi:LmbE family N-acetylglucosaminyl deacetylase